MKNLKYIIISIALVLASVFTNAQTVYTVTKTTDPDPFEHPFNNDDNLCAPEMYGTLQWAINKVNANTGESVIEFNIPGNGVHEIVLNSYLPQIINPVTIDGTSQDGYTQGNPRIRIDGDLLVEQACFSAYNSSLNIEGIWFNNFTYNVINLSAVAESEIKNLLITNNNITDTYSFVFSLDECNNIRFYNNIIEDEQDNVDARNYSFGYYLKSSNNIIIGGTEEGQGNTIKNCNIALYLVVSQQIKISGNKIYNNNVAMTYLYGSNNYIEKPVVSAYTGDVLSGTALPNSTIEVFGSTGEENANEYLVSTVSDVNGDWSVEVSDTEYEHYLVTQTDENNNTSTFGNVIYPDCEVPTNLSASEGISTSHTLSWSGQAGATYNVSVGRHGADDENWFVSFTPDITENYLTISGLDENTVYEFLVNANCGTAESEWAGPYVFNETAQHQTTQLLSMYQNADSVNLDDFLYASILPDAIQYEFNVIQTDSGVNQIITKDVNFFSLLELENNEAFYDIEYKIKVRAFFDNDTTEWGEETILRTFDKQQYEYGKLFIKFNTYLTAMPWDTSKGNIEGYISIDGVSELAEFFDIVAVKRRFGNKTIRRIPEFINSYEISFNKNYSTDSLLNVINDSDFVNLAYKVPHYELYINDPGYSPTENCNCNNCTECYQQYLVDYLLGGSDDYWNLLQNQNTERVIVAVLDNAFSVGHEDLIDNIYVNIGEIPSDVTITDANNNGIIDGFDLLQLYPSFNSLNELLLDPPNPDPNNIFNDNSDSDGNGFADDVIGWDWGNYDNGVISTYQPIDYADDVSHKWLHGTHVAALACATTDNQKGIASLSYNNASIMPVKLGNDNSYGDNIFNSTQGIEYAVNNGADIISMSFGGPLEDPDLQTYITETVNDLDIAFIAAAGNSGDDEVHYPAAFDDVVGVGSVNHNNNQLSTFSTYGYFLDLLAPGGDNLSDEYIISAITLGTEEYGCIKGTSMACPIVSSLWAALLSLNPNLSVDDIYSCIASTATQQEYYNSNIHGDGVINPFDALKCIIGQELSPNIEILSEHICKNEEHIFQAYTTSGVPESYLWECESSNVTILNNDEQETSIIFSEDGTYEILLTIFNTYNEYSTVSIEVTVSDIEVEIISNTPVHFCANTYSEFMLNCGCTPPVTLTYQTPDGSTLIETSNSNIVSINIDQEGFYNILEAQDANGCSVTINYTLEGIEEYCSCNSNFNNNWVFGSQQTLNFQVNNILQTLSPYSFSEAYASVSNNDGELLFYSNGVKIYRANGEELYNLPEDVSSNNDILIIPSLDNRKFTLYVTEQQEGSGPPAFYININYNIPFDAIPQPNDPITIEGPFNLLPAGYNQHLTERMTWAPRTDETGYWLITSALYSDSYINIPINQLNEIDENNINTNDFGPMSGTASSLNAGQIKYNDARNLVATAYFSQNSVRLYSFDTNDGSMNFLDEFELAGSNAVYPYGLEFSPNGQYIYVSDGFFIFQLEINDDFEIDQVESWFLYGHFFGELQLTPSKDKILFTDNITNEFVGAILNPNSVSPLIDLNHYEADIIFDGLGLPQIIPERSLEVNSNLENVCELCGASIVLDIISNYPPLTFIWNNGETNESLTGVCPGEYTVTVSNAIGCETSHTVNVDPPLILSINIINYPCEGQSTGEFIVNGEYGWEPYEFEIWDEEGNSVPNDMGHVNIAPAGNYYVTISDAMGCETSSSFEIVAVPLPEIEIIDITNACNDDNNASATAIVTNGTPPYYYNWDNGETSATATQLNVGVHSVTVTDSNGCSSSASVEIQSLNVDASFKYYPCLELNVIEQQQALFYAAAIPESEWELYEFEWDMSNGLTANTPTVVPDYEYEGYYCPRLTVSREGCEDTQQETVFVYPTDCYCDIAPVYDVNQYSFISVTIESGESVDWDAREVWILGNLTLEPNATLTLKDCIIHMAPNSRVIVKRNAELISNASTFTSWELGTECNHMWQGIEVWGNHLMPDDRGIIRFISENNFVKNAHIGVLLGARNTNCICDAYYQSSANPYNLGESSGIIKAENVDFINNGTDIKFNRSIEPVIINTGSGVFNCNFICDPELLDDGYNSEHPDPYGFGFSNWSSPPNTFFNPRNPWAARANELQRTSASIWAFSHNLATIKNSNFSNKENCILTYQTKYDVFDCKFSEARYGINIFSGTSSLDLSHEIHECTFDLIPNDLSNPESGAHIRIDGGMFDFIHDNTFGGYNTEQSLNGNGVNLTNSSGFRVIENNFNNLQCGVKVSDSGDSDSEGGFVGAGLSTTHPDWTGNEYFQCKTNIITTGTNDKLQLKCNMCDNPYESLFDVNFNSSGSLANQGSYPFGPYVQLPGNSSKFAAGNEFTSISVDPTDLTAFYKKITSTTDETYGYYYHSNPFVAIPFGLGSINTYDIYCDKEYNNISCKPPYIGPIAIEVPEDIDPSFDYLTPIGLLNNQIDNLEFEYDNLVLSLDNGNTLQLLSDIYDRSPQGKLKNDLINSSPLSDTVLIALIIEYPLSHGNFKNVMKRNLPVSNNVSPYLSERLETLPNGISRQLIPLMANNPNYTTPAAVEKQINFLALEEQLFINKVIGYLLDTAINDKESALHLIASLDTESSKQILYSNYLLEGNYNEAEAILQTMDRSSEAIDDWVALNEILLSLYQNNNSVYDMDSSEIAFVRNLAYKCPSGRASSGARAIIHLLFGEEVPDCVFMNNRSATKLIKDVEFVMPDCDAYIEDNFPDPFTNYTLINYYLPEDTEGRIVVTDMLGRIMAEYNLIIGENTLEIRNNNWASGVYSYGMIVNGKAIEFKKMIIN